LSISFNTYFIGTPSQEAALTTRKEKLNSKDKTLTYTSKNQFTEAEQVVEKHVKKHVANNMVFTGHSPGGGLAQYSLSNMTQMLLLLLRLIYLIFYPKKIRNVL
jgi:hypothetical protein